MDTQQFIKKLSGVVFDNTETIKTGAELINLIKNSTVHDNNPFHEETLFDHLLGAGDFAHRYAIKRGWIDNNNWLYFVAGFLHDVGKPGAERPRFGHKKNKMSLKGHAVCGAAMMDSWILNESFLREFNLSIKEAKMIATVANFHMCVFTNETTHLNLLKTAVGDSDTAKLLCAVRHGDSMAKTPQQINDDDDDFEKHMLSDCKADIFPPNNLGLLINVTGFSGCGKSTIAHQTINFLEEKYGLKLGRDVFWINRDNITLSIVAAENSSLNERDAFNYYRNNKDRLSPRVNAEINARVSEVLSAGERVCILDTMALMSCTARRAILKNVPKDTITIDLWAHRRKDTYTEKEANCRLGGMTLAQQLAINSRNITSDMDVIGSDVAWYALDSVMEDRFPAAASSSKSMYVLPIGHNKHLMRDRYFALLGRLMDERDERIGRLQTLPPILSDDTRNMTLHEIVSGLIASDESLERFKRFFKSHSYTISTIKFDENMYLVSIKYIDKQNKIMSHKWAREARGMGFVIDVSVKGNPVVKKIKNSLERCVEVLSLNHHVRNGVEESQDIKTLRDLSFLDKEQREVVEIFNRHTNEPLSEQEDWFITSKVDGCLLIVSIYNKKDDEQVYNYMAKAVKACNMWHVFDNDVLYVPSTSGSLEIGPNMKTTLITAAAGALRATRLKPEHDPDWVWYEANLGQDLMRAMSAYYPYNPKTMIMEMVCANRTTYDGLTEHREIAVSYPKSALYVLGCYDNAGVYTPVYRMETIDSNTFSEPATTRINKPSDALNKMDILVNYITSDPQRSPLAVSFHPEGFILTRHDKKNGLLASCKLKTSVYYKAHSLSGILDKMYDSKTKMLMTVEAATNNGSLNVNDIATIEYMRDAVTVDDDEEGSESLIGIKYKSWRFERVFPEVARFLYVVNGHIQEKVKKFCDDAIRGIIDGIARGTATHVDYSELPKTIRNEIDSNKGGPGYETVCRYIISSYKDEYYKNGITRLFRDMFGADAHTNEKVFGMAQNILKINKSWNKNETKNTKVSKDLVEMLLSGKKALTG